MKALENLPPRERILRALEITAGLCPSVLPPFHVES